MNDKLFPFVFTFIAGLSTLIGIFPILIKVKNINNVVRLEEEDND